MHTTFGEEVKALPLCRYCQFLLGIGTSHEILSHSDECGSSSAPSHLQSFYIDELQRSCSLLPSNTAEDAEESAVRESHITTACVEIRASGSNSGLSSGSGVDPGSTSAAAVSPKLADYTGSGAAVTEQERIELLGRIRNKYSCLTHPEDDNPAWVQLRQDELRQTRKLPGEGDGGGAQQAGNPYEQVLTKISAFVKTTEQYMEADGKLV